MARFDVYRAQGVDGLLLDCQANFLSHFATRFVVPLLPEHAVPLAMPRLHPKFVVDETTLIMATHLATAVPARELRTRVTSLSDSHKTITSALDMLTLGF